jgi:hypothetical protein
MWWRRETENGKFFVPRRNGAPVALFVAGIVRYLENLVEKLDPMVKQAPQHDGDLG